MKRDTRAAFRARAAATEKTIDQAVAARHAEMTAKHLELRVAAAASEAARVRLTREDMLGATHVRTSAGWHRVATVNIKTVSVETGYSWVDRYRFDQILQVRTVLV